MKSFVLKSSFPKNCSLYLNIIFKFRSLAHEKKVINTILTYLFTV